MGSDRNEGQSVRGEVQSNVLMEKHLETTPEKSGNFRLVEEAICKLGQVLLWDSLAEKSQLTEIANQISQAVGVKVMEHGACHQPVTEIATAPLCNPAESLSSTTVRPRRYSGEYLPMSTSPTRRLSLDIPKPKPHEQIPVSPIVFENMLSQRRERGAATDYVPMFPVSHECSEQCSHCPPTPSIDQIKDSSDDDHGDDSGLKERKEEEKGGEKLLKYSFIEETDECDKDLETAKNIASFKTSDEVAADRTPPQTAACAEGIALQPVAPGDDDEGSQKSEESGKQLCSAVAYEGLPHDWHKLPADVKYTHDAVTMVILMEEQSRVMARLQQLENLQVTCMELVCVLYLAYCKREVNEFIKQC